MSQIWDFTLTLNIFDPEQLLQAARARPDAAGMTTEEFYADDGSIDINACLVTLLDPGSLPGAEIFGSETDLIDVHEIDLGDRDD